MILTWVLSLILLCSSLIKQLESLATQSLIELETMTDAQEQFFSAEKTVVECEHYLAQRANRNVSDSNCIYRDMGNHVWRISSKQKPGVEVHVYVDPQTDTAQRLNWRQTFE